MHHNYCILFLFRSFVITRYNQSSPKHRSTDCSSASKQNQHALYAKGGHKDGNKSYYRSP